MTREEVEEVAGGRIWTGRQAMEIGLVDELGGLDRAVQLVLEAAGHDPQETAVLDFYPRPPSFFEILTQGLSPLFEARPSPFSVLPILRTPEALELPREVVELLHPY